MHTQDTSPFRPETYATLAAAEASEQGFRHGDFVYTEDGNLYVGNSDKELQHTDTAFPRTTAQLAALTPTNCHVAVVSDGSPKGPAFYDVTSGSWIDLLTLEAL